jgi:hypothetical protein
MHPITSQNVVVEIAPWLEEGDMDNNNERTPVIILGIMIHIPLHIFFYTSGLMSCLNIVGFTSILMC